MISNCFRITIPGLIVCVLLCCVAADSSELAPPIRDQTWRLESIGVTDALNPETVSEIYTLEFRPDGTLAGRNDCNRWWAELSKVGSGDSVVISSVRSTRAYCGRPDRFLPALQNTRRIKLIGDRLHFLDSKERVVLIFTSSSVGADQIEGSTPW